MSATPHRASNNPSAPPNRPSKTLRSVTAGRFATCPLPLPRVWPFLSDVPKRASSWVRDVRARDQQHKRDPQQQHPERPADVTDKDLDQRSTPTPLPAFDSLYCFSRLAPIMSISAARRRVTPGFRRATPYKPGWLPRVANCLA